MQRWPAIFADEDADSARLVEDTLAELSYDVVRVASADVVGTARTYKGALVLVAHAAPYDAAPWLALKMLQREPGYYHSICLLDRYNPAAITAAFAAGADDVIAKPLIPGELSARLRHAKHVLSLEEFRGTLEGEGALLAEISTRASFHSRRYLQAQLVNELARARRFKHALGIVVAEARRHQGSERVLRNFGQLLSGLCRSRVDWIARHGKQSFALVLPETDLNGAMCVAARMQQEVSANEAISLPKAFNVNVGVSALNCDRISPPAQTDAPQMLLDAAETYLREAVQKGPGQIAGGPAPHP